MCVSRKSILTGIPLRAFEIMGSGGFLLSNYQREYEEYSCNGVDYVYYMDYEDLMEKVEYYLSHEKERKEIAKNGYENVKANHTYRNRVDAIMKIISEGERNFAG